MARRHEDFDEMCDPENPREIKIVDVEKAAERMKLFDLITPCVPSHYQREFVTHLFYKLENQQKSGSVKERGAVNVLQLLPLAKRKIGVVVATTGNLGLALSYHGQKMGIPVTLVLPNTVSQSKLQKCFNLGARVVVQGGNLSESQRYARAIAKEKGLTYINGRDHPRILAAHGTVALEILDDVPYVEAVIVPMGAGGLAAAIATVIKEYRPECLVYGVQPECNPAFFESLAKGEMVATPVHPTLADSIAVPNVGVNSFFNAQPLLDKVLLVKEKWIARAILHLAEVEKIIVEGAGACPLAAFLGKLVPELKTKQVVCVVSGGNIDTVILSRCLNLGFATEGRLVKFRVGIKNNTLASAALTKMLANGGYNIIHQMGDKVWTEGEDAFMNEMHFVCETHGLEHALELKRIIERAYPYSSTFENEPFNDKKTCPCFVRTSMPL